MVLRFNIGSFDPEVWGTVSDWAILLATLITARYLWKTLQSQIEIQKLQLKVTRIENDKYMKEHTPSFVFDLVSRKLTPQENHMDAWFIINCKLSNNLCNNANFSILSTSSEVDSNYGTHKWFDVIQEGDTIELRITTRTKMNTFDQSGANFNIVIEFTDPAKNTYIQGADVVFDYSSYKINKNDNPQLQTT